MQIVTIECQDHRVLREPAQAVKLPLSKKHRKFAQRLQTKMIELGNAVGLAATQVGVPLQIIAFQIPESVLKFRKNAYAAVPPTILINPRYSPLKEEGLVIDWEGCFSIPEYMGEVPRYHAIQYEGYLPSGKKVSEIARGFLARVLQHEIGHLNGELYKDLLTTECRYGAAEAMMIVRMDELKRSNNA